MADNKLKQILNLGNHHTKKMTICYKAAKENFTTNHSRNIPTIL